MSAVGQLLEQVEALVNNLIGGRDKRLDALEDRVAKLEAAGKSSAAAKTATARPTAAAATGKASTPK